MRLKQPAKSETTLTTSTATSNNVADGPLTLKPQLSSVVPSRILVPVDFSESSFRALDYALALAEPFQATVILLHIVEPAIHSAGYMSFNLGLDESNQNLIATGRERLAEFCHQRIAPGKRAETLVRMGRAPSEISDTAKALAADLIVIGTQGESALRQMTLGSTAEKVARQAPCPVLLVPRPPIR